MKFGWFVFLEVFDDIVKIVCLVKLSEIKKLKIFVLYFNFMVYRLKVMIVILVGVSFLIFRRK